MIITGNYTLKYKREWQQLQLEKIYLECDTSAASVTINLFEILDVDRSWNPEIYITDYSNNAGTNQIQIIAGGADTIDDATNNVVFITGNGESVIMQPMAEGKWISIPSKTSVVPPPDANTWNMSLVAFVDPVNGDDLTAVIGDGNLPFKTLQNAIAAPGTKALYYCMSGTYSGTINLQSGDYYFMPGAVAGSGSRFQDNGSFVDINIYGSLSVGFTSYAFSFTGLQSQVNIECFDFDRTRQIVWTDNQANVTVNCKKIKCTGNNGGGYACRTRGSSNLTLNVVESCETYHWLIAGGFGSTLDSNTFTINCPNIIIPVVSTYGTAFKALINDQGQTSTTYNINGKVTHEVTTTTTAFGIVESALLLYVAVGTGEPGSFFHFKGGCSAIGQPIVLAYYILTTGLITLKDGDYKSQNSICISSFHGNTNAASNIDIKVKNCSLEGTRVLQIGYGRNIYFEQCSLYANDVTQNIIANLLAGNPGGGTPTLQLYNCIGEHINVAATAFLDDATGVVNFNTVNTQSNLPIGAGVADGWAGYSQIVGFTIPNI
jgi:hypothetical protein